MEKSQGVAGWELLGDVRVVRRRGREGEAGRLLGELTIWERGADAAPRLCRVRWGVLERGDRGSLGVGVLRKPRLRRAQGAL